MARLSFALALVAAVCVAAVAGRTVRSSLPSSWQRVERLNKERATHSVTIVVTPRNADLLTNIVLSVSDPQSPRYGEYLTKDEVNKLTAPAAEQFDAVLAWVQAHHEPAAITADRHLGSITVKDSLASLEALLQTSFSRVQSTEVRQQTAFHAESYTIPAEVDAFVATVFGVHGLPLPPRPAVAAPGTPPDVTPDVTPDVLTKAYNVKGVKATGSLKNRQAVAEFQGQLMNDSDLSVFFNKYVPSAPASDAKVYKFHGTHRQGLGVEAQLDIQYIMGVAPGIKTEFYEQLNMDFCSDLKNWTGILLSNDDIPLVHSISYGWQGNLTQIGCTDAEVQVVDADFQKLAARGISIIFASGDSGSGYTPPQPPRCSRTPGTKSQAYQGKLIQSIHVPEGDEGAYICCSLSQEIGAHEHVAGWTYQPVAGESEATCSIFSSVSGTKSTSGCISGKPSTAPSTKSTLWPSWPASSPWVTSVGATRFINDVVNGPEAAVSEEDHFGSGGGFSAQFPVGSWQKTAVDAYLASATLPDASKVNWAKNGRATPDVSALGTGYQVVDAAHSMPVGGTSASAPCFAGLVSLLNEARLNAGGKPLGFLNPWIYQNQDGFNDITQGSDKVGRGGGTLEYGFDCAKGWDPVTGVGTPDFEKLLKTL